MPWVSSLKTLALVAHLTALTETEPKRFVGITDVGAHVEPVQAVKHVVVEAVPAKPTVLAVNVVMTVVEDNPVDVAQALKLAPTEFVWELPFLIVVAEFVVITELEEVVDLALLDKDAEQESVSAIMTVRKEIVETQSKRLEPTLDCVPLALVELAHQNSLVEPMEDALNRLLVMLP